MQSEFLMMDLHRHLEGCIRPESILEIADEFGLSLPAWSVEELLPFVQVTTPVADVMTYIAKFELMQASMVNPDVIRRLTYECLEDAYKEGLHYVELRFSPVFMAEKHGLELPEVVDAVCDGRAGAIQALPIRAQLIGIMSRTYGPDSCWRELKAVLEGRERGVVAVDVAGDEIRYPAEYFRGHFAEAREAGMRITVHAGESTSSEQVKLAVTELGAERLGHAVRAVDDPGLMALIAERGIGIESCLTSNIQTGVVPSYEQHPLLVYLQQGILVTLNTDSTVISGVNVESEFRIAREIIGLSESETTQLRENAFRVAFLSESERVELMESLSGSNEKGALEEG